jgi:hypothetical protein
MEDEVCDWELRKATERGELRRMGSQAVIVRLITVRAPLYAHPILGTAVWGPHIIISLRLVDGPLAPLERDVVPLSLRILWGPNEP